jgi:hypothetical protein
MWVPTTELPVSPGHPFYAKLNTILDEAGFDRFAEAECQQFYAPVMGRPSLPAGRLGRMTPRPETNLPICHDVLAPSARWRRRVVDFGRVTPDPDSVSGARRL